MAAAWLAAWIVAAILIALTHYDSRDPDSQLYAGLSARMATEPVARWIAPEWWGFWNSYGPYCEHPVGMFVVPAAIAVAGYPVGQAAYAINALYQVASFFLITSIGLSILSRREAAALGWILQILPIAFVFRIRANQEYAVLAGLLIALWSTERARSRPRWIVGMLGGFCAVLLVKGVFAFMVPVTCAAWLIARGTTDAGSGRRSAAWLGVVLMPVAGLFVTWAYESAYVHVTGRSFLQVYQSRQLPEDALSSGSLAWRIAYTATWYASRVIWYPFPWSVLAIAVAAAAVRRGYWWPRRGAFRNPSPAWQGAWFALATAIVLSGAFSLAHRKADRYIFPVYFLVGAVGAVAAARGSARLQRLTARLDRPWMGAAIYVVLFLVSLAARGKLPVVTFWRT